MEEILKVNHILRAAVAGVALTLAGGAAAQSYPARTITFLDNIPGGAQEAAKRTIVDKIKSNTGATIVYEFRPGGGGALGLQAIKNAAPDGYTIGSTYASAINLNPLQHPELNLNPLKDYAPITLMFTAGIIWTGREEHPAKDIRDLVAMAKAKPESIKIGVFGAGNRFFMAQLEEKTGAKFLQVPFKTLGEGMAAVLGGVVDASFDSPTAVLGQKGKIKAFMSSLYPRWPYLADTPTSVELYGVEFNSWQGVLAPAGTRPEVVNWLSREFVRAVNDPAITKNLIEQGLALVGSTPAEFTATLSKEIKENDALVKKYPDIH